VGRQFCGATTSTQAGCSWRRVSTSTGHHRKRPRREGKAAAVALTLGRRCSRGRLEEHGRRGVVVHDDSVPALLLPPCVDVPEWPLLDSSLLNTDGTPVFSARRGQRRVLLLSPPPCHTRFYKENRMHLTCAPGSIYTHDRQKECNTIAVIKCMRVKLIQYSLLHSDGWTRRSKHKR
jgi:hypothetical protein